ncbi:GNAT family N-acetyltransferase [Streptomyces avicenniae]|uniref:GNAT family N-acetyltransferase n=1 Tax=Streptomyces avicenniae TaxID=500153 RepID=UPI000699B9C2|nr:GNAT family N-acetyltransferase [Streptomyces avicenniae]
MTTELRGLDAADWESWYRSLEWAFGGGREPSEERAAWREVTEIDRSLALWDKDRIVGSFSSFSFQLSVPGGALVAAAGVTMVHVAPTHRRRGLLRRMMRQGLDTARDAGEPLAVLTASEPAIYGRFGFGVATHALSATLDVPRTGLRLPPGTEDVTLRLADPAEVVDRCEELYARLVPRRPGMIARQPSWPGMVLLDPRATRGGASPRRCLLAERDGELVGYARYATLARWAASVPDGVVLVKDLDAADPAAYAAMLRFLMELDLMSSVELTGRPVDDPLVHLVTDMRRSRLRVADRLYLRPVDVGAALGGRAYASEVDVVLDVTDDFCPWNSGAWRLSGGPGGAVCERTRDAADLSLDVRALGAAYLGGTSLAALAGAGQVREERPGALTAAATAFSSPVAPWLPHNF